jgi:L-2,4-diaminobutyric acid acetyltransferase
MIVMNSPIRFRPALRGDGSSLWQLVQSTGSLELNSSYFYLTFAEFFGGTCLVAEGENELLGAIIAFRPPLNSEALFVWQIGVAPSARQQGLAKRMLHEILKFPACRGVRFLQATITPDNIASHRTFRGFAREVGAKWHCTDFFTADYFPDSHEAEELISIGPLPTQLQDLQGAKNDYFRNSREKPDHIETGRGKP